MPNPIQSEWEKVLEVECEVLRRRLFQAVARLTELKQRKLVREIMGKQTRPLTGRGPNERRTNGT